jgi:hypothetical protein
MGTIEERKLEFDKEQFEFFKNRLMIRDVLMMEAVQKNWHYEFLKLSIVLILIIVLIYYTINQYGSKKNEKFAPYASILAPDIINSTAGFDFPNQFGETTEPYQKEKDSSENKLFQKTHDLVGR